MGRQGYLRGSDVNTLNKPIKKAVASTNVHLNDFPDVAAARKMILAKGDGIDVLAEYKDFLYVSSNNNEGWILKSALEK